MPWGAPPHGRLCHEQRPTPDCLQAMPQALQVASFLASFIGPGCWSSFLIRNHLQNGKAIAQLGQLPVLLLSSIEVGMLLNGRKASLRPLVRMTSSSLHDSVQGCVLFPFSLLSAHAADSFCVAAHPPFLVLAFRSSFSPAKLLHQGLHQICLPGSA